MRCSSGEIKLEICIESGPKYDCFVRGIEKHHIIFVRELLSHELACSEKVSLLKDLSTPPTLPTVCVEQSQLLWFTPTMPIAQQGHSSGLKDGRSESVECVLAGEASWKYRGRAVCLLLLLSS